jgi:hypothetical protein
MSILKVIWDKIGSEFTYNIWCAKQPKGPWIRYNDNILTDSYGTYIEEYTTNEYIIDGLEENKNYYVKVTSNDRYNSWWIGYEGEESTTGGYGHDEDAPYPPFGNSISFKINIL